MKKLFYFSVAILVSIILFWFGSLLLFVTADTFSQTIYFVSGLLLIFGGVSLLGARDIKYHWQAGGVVLLLAIYCLARWSGAIKQPWLATIFGVASWLSALMLLYITWPGHKTTHHDHEG